MPAVTNKVCLHCGSVFVPTERRRQFCCAGCEFVHLLIARNGLSQFYELQEGVAPPVRGTVFEQRDWSWLEALVQEAEREPVPQLRLDLQGLTCLACGWLIEQLFQRQAGGLEVRVDSGLGTIEMRWQRGKFDATGFIRELQRFGYLAGPPHKTPQGTSRALVPRLGVCAALAMNTMLFTLPAYLGLQPGEAFAAFFERVAFVLASLSLLVGGSYFARRAVSALRHGVLHMDLPITLGLVAAYAGSVWGWAFGVKSLIYFDFVAVFTALMLLGRWLQQRTVERHRHQLLAARAEIPAVLRDGRRTTADQLQPGQRYAVEPAGLIPVRSRLRSPAAALGLEWIHGESEAIIRHARDLVPSGALNHTRSRIELEALEPWSDSLLAQLLRVEPASAPRHRAAERFIRRYLAVVLVAGVLGAAGWWWVTGDAVRALQVLISVLVVSCPCASGVALPLVDDLAAARLRNEGVFIREHSLWSRLCGVRRIIFDKTGTLTLETLTLRNPEAIDALSAEARAALCTLTAASTHPVSTALRAQLLAAGLQPDESADLRETPGQGVEWKSPHGLWRLGRSDWACADPALSGTILARDGVPLTAFHFGEEPRPGARAEMRALQSRGLAVHILSGDQPDKVSAFAERLGLVPEHCHGGLAPADKADALRALDARDTLYLGDGANDSLAFDAAWCTGTPACDRGLLEHKADFYFLGQSLGGLAALLAMAGRRRRAVRAVVAFALAYNAAAITTAFAGLMTPLLAAVIMPLSSLASLGLVFLALRTPHRRRRRSGVSGLEGEIRAERDALPDAPRLANDAA